MNFSTPRFNILYQKRETPKKRNNKFRNDNSDFIKGLQFTKIIIKLKKYRETDAFTCRLSFTIKIDEMVIEYLDTVL